MVSIFLDLRRANGLVLCGRREAWIRCAQGQCVASMQSAGARRRSCPPWVMNRNERLDRAALPRRHNPATHRDRASARCLAVQVASCYPYGYWTAQRGWSFPSHRRTLRRMRRMRGVAHEYRRGGARRLRLVLSDVGQRRCVDSVLALLDVATHMDWKKAWTKALVWGMISRAAPS